MTSMKSSRFWLVLALLWCMMIFVATASPASSGGQTQYWIERLTGLGAEQARLMNVMLRKAVHLVAFGLLAVLLYLGLGGRLRAAWLLTAVYAASDEIHQAFVPGRTASMMDVGIDAAGAFLALLIISRRKGRPRD